MTKNTTIVSVIRWAVGLLTIGVVIAFFGFDADTAQGVLGGGVVMILSFFAGGFAAQRTGEAAAAGFTGGAVGLVVLKLPVLGLAVWALMTHFGPIAVVAGGCVVVMAAVFSGVSELVSPISREA
jgi:hypothetical protein